MIASFASKKVRVYLVLSDQKEVQTCRHRLHALINMVLVMLKYVGWAHFGRNANANRQDNSKTHRRGMSSAERKEEEVLGKEINPAK